MTKKETAIEAAEEIRREQGREPKDEEVLRPESVSPEEDLIRQMEEDTRAGERVPRRKGCGERR